MSVDQLSCRGGRMAYEIVLDEMEICNLIPCGVALNYTGANNKNSIYFYMSYPIATSFFVLC